MKDTRSHDAIKEWKKTGVKPKGLKKVNLDRVNWGEAATKALHGKLKKAGRRDYELEAETKNDKDARIYRERRKEGWSN